VKKYSVLPSAREHLDAINTNQMQWTYEIQFKGHYLKTHLSTPTPYIGKLWGIVLDMNSSQLVRQTDRELATEEQKAYHVWGSESSIFPSMNQGLAESPILAGGAQQGPW
jgi:hypothetical protein